ncbi:TonB-dependent receptor [Rhodocytophaga aerolata]|uniref:TonB-dependent receptor n=1 Tax=Rhodocytophaga aerolata TaxID=455078 RepID=A0ABT8R8X3_9BACT|nr:TonB-dependent receptor [Rhodocytophaga aerolata]MDO1448533.1 TonB-dependent receptor [Rhodocytophaga aerolata]
MRNSYTYSIIALLFFCFLLGVGTAYSQTGTQIIRGRITDKDSKIGLPGAAIVLLDNSPEMKGTVTDTDGYFKLANVPLGKHSIRVSYIGYQELVIPTIVVNAGKEVVLALELETSIITMTEVVVNANSKDGSVNEMATVSARTFSLEETERYAGSRQDPARMASNFAGVQGSDDSRNDIVIRGNSPAGVLYRLEDVNIPNPNHFAIAGTTGGPVSILNNKVLGTSDFMTGAFPAEYGNSLAGVFDLKMRNGNNTTHEFTGQFGILGTELAAEGPISRKNRSSYLATYRYSTLRMFQAIGINIGTTAVPNYQDASFKLNFPVSKKSNFSVFGIGGTSKVDIIVSKFTEPPTDLYGDIDRDQYFRSNMGVAGASFSHTFNASTFAKVSLSASHSKSWAFHDLVFRYVDNTDLVPCLGYTFTQGITSLAGYVTHKLSARHTLNAGLFADRYQFNFIDSVLNENTNAFENRFDYRGNSYLLQPYVQSKYRITENLTLNSGLHSQWFLLNNSFSLEPRLGMKWKFSPRKAFSAGYGLHSQMQPTYIYFYHIPGTNANALHNKNLGFTRSHHFVLSYDHSLSRQVRVKAEAYYQSLFKVPVSIVPSSFSLLNQGSTFERFFPDTLTNAGTGENYGIELTLEKFFNNHYFFMLTGSLFESTYKGSDGVKRNTDFNGNFALNLLGGTEYTVKNKTFTLGGKLTWAGGRRHSPVDEIATQKANDVVIIDELRNTLQFPNYFRADIRLGFKLNSKRLTHEIALDLVNLFNIKNMLSVTYVPDRLNPEAGYLRQEYQLGFLPLFYYKIDF